MNQTLGSVQGLQLFGKNSAESNEEIFWSPSLPDTELSAPRSDLLQLWSWQLPFYSDS